MKIGRVLLMGLVLLGTWSACAEPNGLVVLLTDYGADSIYVGILKGAIYTKWPGAKVDTLTNSVPSFDIEAGGALLAEACGEFPEGTTFCCVVDPGVGTERKCIAVETKAGQYFVAPDNGLLTAVVERDGIRQMREASNRRYWREGVVSSTFHGRDIFGPVSASVAKGAVLRTLGSPVKEIVKIAIPVPGVKDGMATGRVRRVDPYGNLVTDLTGEMLAELGIELGDAVTVRLGDHTLKTTFEQTYASVAVGLSLLLIQSNGAVECAINQGSMAEKSGATFHTPVRVWKGHKEATKLIAGLVVKDGKDVVFSVVVYPDGTGSVSGGAIQRSFKLDPARFAALKTLCESTRERYVIRSDAVAPKADDTKILISYGSSFIPFADPDAVLEEFRPVEAELRALYEEQMRAQVRPRGAP